MSGAPAQPGQVAFDVHDDAAVEGVKESGERLAPQAVGHNQVARDLIQACLRRSRRKAALPGLDGLAQRVGVLV